MATLISPSHSYLACTFNLINPNAIESNVP